MAQILVRSRKWNGATHRRTVAQELGTDAHGTWLWMRAGTPVETPAGTYRAHAALRLIPLGEMWSVYYVPAHPSTRRPKQLYIDITTRATRRGDVIDFIDLDLDVERLDDGEVRILDEDEFAANSRSWSYPHELIDAAQATCHRIVRAVIDGEPPFDGCESAWWPGARQ